MAASNNLLRGLWQTVSSVYQRTCERVFQNQNRQTNVRILQKTRREKADILSQLKNSTETEDKLRQILKHLQELLLAEEKCRGDFVDIDWEESYIHNILQSVGGIVRLYYDHYDFHNAPIVVLRLRYIQKLFLRLSYVWCKSVENYKQHVITNVESRNKNYVTDNGTYKDILPFLKRSIRYSIKKSIRYSIKLKNAIKTAKTDFIKEMDIAIANATEKCYQHGHPPLELYPRIAKAVTLSELNPMGYKECPVCFKTFSTKVNLSVLENCPHVFCSSCIRQWLRQKLNCPVCRASARTAISTQGFLAFRHKRYCLRRRLHAPGCIYSRNC